MKRFLKVFTVSLAAALLCSSVFASPKADSTAPGQQVPSAKAETKADPALSGKVVETMNAGGYTYILIEKNGKQTWVAIPMTQVTVGKEITLQPGAEMQDFSSPSLKRTFKSIIFSGGLMPEPGSASAPHGGKAAAASPSPSNEKISVEKAAGPDAYTVSEIHTKKAALNEKTAVVKAKVVKVSEGIMGKNFIHLKDGTGDAALGTNKLVVTSQDLPSVGDIVTMKGTIYSDKDFGSGYKYTVIMEKATVVK
jgi:hypothetical protein